MFSLSNCKPIRRQIMCWSLISFFFVLTSCDKEDIQEPEIKNPNLVEGSIDLYIENTKHHFEKIYEYPFVKFSQQKMDYDTIGFSYTGYPDKASSILGSLQISILNDMNLYYVEYRYPMDSYAITFARWGDEDNTEHETPLAYDINEKNNLVVGKFNGNLYMGGSSLDKEAVVVDSCVFSISKK